MALVYRHRRVDNLEVFYVGAGENPKRPYNLKNRSRNKYWREVLKQTDIYIEVVADGISMEDALELESFLIKTYGRIDLGTGTLVNLSDQDGYGNLAKEVRQNISKAVSIHTKKCKWFNDGINEYFIMPSIAKPNYIEGRLTVVQSTKNKMAVSKFGRHWFNNGVKEKFCYECPKGFTKGRLKRTK